MGLLVDGVATGCAVTLTGVFGLAATTKLRTFRQTVASFRRLGIAFPGTVAGLVVLAEIACVLLLWVAPRLGSLASISLLLLFTAAVARWVTHGTAGSCSCFGSRSDATLSRQTVLRNVFLLIAAWGAGLASRRVISVPGFFTVGSAVMAACLVLAIGDLKNRTGGIFTARPMAGPLKPS